jgi:hypothetical protein
MSFLCAVLMTRLAHGPEHPCIGPPRVPSAPGTWQWLLTLLDLFAIKEVVDVETFYNRTIQMSKVNACSSGVMVFLTWMAGKTTWAAITVNVMGAIWVMTLTAVGTAAYPFAVLAATWEMLPKCRDAMVIVRKWLFAVVLVLITLTLFGGFQVLTYYYGPGTSHTSELSLMEVWFAPSQLLLLATFALPLLELHSEEEEDPSGHKDDTAKKTKEDTCEGKNGSGGGGSGGGSGGSSGGGGKKKKTGCRAGCGRTYGVLKRIIVQTAGPSTSLLTRVRTSAQRAVKEILSVLVMVAVLFLPVLPLVFRLKKEDGPDDKVEKFSFYSRGGAVIWMNITTHCAVLKIHHHQIDWYVTQPLEKLKGILSKASTDLDKQKSEDPVPFAMGILRLETTITKQWQWARPMVVASVSWYTLSLLGAYNMVVDPASYSYGDAQPLYQTFVFSAAYFAHTSLQALSEIQLFNKTLREATVGALENKITALAMNMDKEKDAGCQRGKQQSPSTVWCPCTRCSKKTFSKACSFMGGMRPLLEKHVQKLSLSLPGNVSEATLRKAVVILLVPLIALDLVPADLLEVAAEMFPPLESLKHIKTNENGLSLFGWLSSS